ncbi:MAG: 3-mercaptopyruvate sulfurtransferase SseA/sterol desaturase [Crocinitomix sp.]|jgi:3-mercaptopyruvate sulfurtransferase SseA/sterol desaturase/sphingolipid hydroxylase (fatty acid hydroxylase superfamily)
MKQFGIIVFILFLSISNVFAQENRTGFISPDSLLESFNDYILIDVSKPEKFEESSIHGAVNIWRSAFSKTEGDVSGLIASKKQLEENFSALGIPSMYNSEPGRIFDPRAETLVLFDHKGGSDAARLKWVLNTYGEIDLLLLDGGLKAWGDRNELIDSIIMRPDSVQYRFPLSKEFWEHYTKLEEVQKVLNNEGTIIIDTRSKEEFEGGYIKDGAYRAGRIPGSINIDWAENIEYHGDQTLKADSTLLQLYESKGVTKDKNIICYCHSGTRSSHTTLVLTEILGYENVRNYDGSWIEWSSIDSLPIDTGAVVIPTIEYVASYSEVFWAGFGNFGNYTWNEITFNVSPWYVNYFWLLVVLSLLVWGLEIAFPWRKNQPLIRKDFWVDAFFMFFNFYIFKLIIFMSFSEVSAKFFHDLIGGDTTSYALFNLTSLPIALQLIIFFVATDFIQWFTHVMLHRFSFLWRFHKVHHSIEQMGFAGHLRYHWMENVFYTPMKYIAVMLIGGFTPEMAYIVFYISIAIGHLNHANIGWSYGPLKYIFNNPKMHIWHHAKTLPEKRKNGVNFGISLSIWDYIFGKNYIPSEGRDIELGFDGIEKYPKGFFGLIFSGFRKTPDEK